MMWGRGNANAELPGQIRLNGMTFSLSFNFEHCLLALGTETPNLAMMLFEVVSLGHFEG